MKIWPVEAEITHDTEVFGKMDPYVVMSSREQTWKSKTAGDAGKTPKWKHHDGHFEVEVKFLGDDIKYHLWDEDTLSKDDDIAEGSCHLSAFTREGESVIEEWFGLKYKGKDAGRIKFRAEWCPAKKD